MSTFCRITGRSRGLPKPNYFPLLPPISPADAKRFCKITGKAYGLPSHHFTPVLLGPRRNKVSHCHITEKSENQDPHHFFPGVEHTILVDYRYVIPTLDESQELIAILATKTVDSTKMYAYPVTDRNCSLVFPAKFEAAVRDGDVRDIMLAKDSDQVLLKLKKGLSVTVGFTEMRDVNEAELYEGAGPSEEVLNERKRKRRRTGGTANWMKEIFEKKERAAEEEEEALQMQKSKAVKVKISKESKTDPSPSEWKSVTVDKSISTRAVLSDTSTTALQEPIDVQNVEKLLEVKGTPVVTSLPKPITAQPECVDLKTSLPGIIQQPPAALTENTIGFETAPIAAPFKPLTAEPNAEVQQAIKDINVETLAETEFVAQVFDMDKTENFKKLPLKGEIAEIIENLHLGVEETLTDEQGHKINGLKLDIGAAQKFIAGQTVQTPSGKVFVPGQTVQTPAGPVFVPGLVLQTPDGPQLLPGQQVMVESNGVQTPVFVAGQTLPTRGGEKFVYGQMLSCEDGTKFVPGQTVYTPDGPIFVSGQVVEENDEVRFVPGQTVMSATGPTFVPGQNFQKGEQTVFVPGQTILDENKGWDFLPGQTFTAESGEMKFVPGQTLEIGNVKKFVPGQSVVDESGETQFVPGVAVQNADGVTEFLAGLTVDTPNGRQFLEGQIVRSESGICSFVPGKTTVSENGTKVQFAIAETVADLSFSETDPIGIETKASFFPTSESTDEVFGHMVQTAHGVEFFPGLAAGLPEGKVIPGKLTRGKEVRFVPGVVVNEKFVPGQVVQTDKGEQFIPGQVVETKDGAKFVPGQIVETRSGPKFVPGQTINTEDGPKFVPGQIVETRAGPTFIPGQIISTEEEGSRFVPGQVVETKEGPRFVPGRVIETGDCVTFVPGQVVETSEGLKFIAPDLQSSPEGDCEYTVQGFEVTPEELSILNLNALASQAASSAEMSINSEMLKQLSEAGMSIGRSVPTELPVVDVGTLPSMSAACSLSDKMKLDPVSTVKLSQVLSVVSTLTLNAETAEDASIAQTSESVVINKMLNKMKQYQEEESMDIIFEALSEVLEENMTGEGEEKKLQILDGLYKFISKSENIAPFQQPKKMLTLKNALNADIDKPEEIIEKLSSVLNDDEAAISSAFQHMTKNNPELLQKVVQHVNKSLKGVNVDKNASDILQKAIIDSVRESSIATVNEVLHSDDRNEFKQLILQAVGLARALGMTPVVDVLIDVITDQKSAEVLSEDPVTIEILRRLTIMKQLAEERPTFGTALKQLQSDPELARTDPRLRQLVRESAALMIIPEESVLHSSSDIPTALFHPSNSLAMEDFLARQKHRDPLLIIKHGLQAVVPREVAHSVLTGQVPYTVLDEKGISHFEPMHVLSALRLPKHATHWFSMYACTMQLDDEESTLASSLSVEDLRRPSLEMRRISVDKLKKPPKLVNGHREKTRDDRAKSSSSDDATLNNLDDLRRGSSGEVRKRVVNGTSQQNGERAKSSSSDDATLVETMDCFRKPSIDSFLDAELLTNKLANGHADPYELKGVRLVRDFDANDEQCSEEHSLVNGQSKIISPEDLRRKSFDYLKTYGTYKKRRSSRHLNGTLQSTRDIYLVIEDYVPNRIEEITLHKGDLVVVIDTGEELEEEPKRPRLETEVELTPGTELTGAAFLDSSAAKHKLSVRPPDRRPSLKGRSRSASPVPPAVNARWMVQSIKDPTKQGWIPAKILRLEQKAEIPADDQTIHEAHFQREAVIRELVETEEEFGRDIRRVVERYLKPLDNNSVPRIIRDNKDLIFGNLKQISDFHNTVLIEGVKYYANEPRLLGKTFLRLERDFDKHVTYCRDEPAAQEFLNENTDVRDYFGEVGHRLADDKSLSEHLKLPIQRINDYQLLLKELVKLSNLLGEDTTDLNRALELMLAVPHRANDNKFIGNIEGYHGNIHKLGRLLRHDWFRISHKDGKSKERYLFLFKARILVCKVRRISQDRSVFVLKDIIRLPEVEVKDHPDDSLVFELHSKIPSNGDYPLTITAHKDNVKFAWLNEIRLYSADVLALAEHAADDLRLQEKEDDKHFEPLKGVELEITPDIELEPFVAPPTAKPLRHVPEPKRPPLEAPKKSVLRVGGNTEDKENQEFIEAEQRPSIAEQRPSITEHRSSISEHRSSISERRPSITEHRPSIGEVVISESSKSVQEVRSSQYIQEEESKMSIRSVKTSEYRSVTSSVSEEVYMETSSNQMEQVASSTSSSSRSYKKMEHSVDGKTISHVEEISSTQGGYGDLSGGGGAIDRRQSLLSIQELVSARRSSQVDSLASSASSLFSKPIAGSAVEPGDNAVFEVAIDSSEVTTLSWLKDNKILSDKLADRISATNTDSNFKLEIMNVRPSDSGTYTARASDSSGTVSSCTAQLIVEELTPEEKKRRLECNNPVFLVRLKDTEVLENTFLRFIIKVRGSPMPSVTFFKNGELIHNFEENVKIIEDKSDSGFYELVILNVKPSDAGTYKCIASNEYGEESCEAKLSVTDDKDIWAEFETGGLQPGEKPVFSWFRDGVPFDPKERFSIAYKDKEDSLQMEFKNVTPEDAGLYTCVAATNSGKIACSAELTVQGASSFTGTPVKPEIKPVEKRVEVTLDETAMVEAKISGAPKPKITWSKDGQEITAGGRFKFLWEDEETMALVIKNVCQDDAGDYVVNAHNESGVDTQVIKLVIRAGAKFRSYWEDHTIMENHEIKLSIGLDGAPTPGVIWYKDGKVINSSDRVKLSYDEESTTHTLYIQRASMEDTGSYSIIATNELSQDSAFSKIQVMAGPRFTKEMPKAMTTKEGDNVTFQVKVKGDPEPEVKWMRNDQEIVIDDAHWKYSVDGEFHTLQLCNNTRADTGEITCEISNNHGTNWNTCQNNVRCAPIYRDALSDFFAKEGDTDVEFMVKAEAFPKPKVRWFFNNVEITEKNTEFERTEEGPDRENVTMYKLILKDATIDKAGAYRCKVSNDLGGKETNCALTVKCKPKIKKELEDLVIDEGDTLNLTIECFGVPEPEITWYRNGQEVTGDSRITISRDKKRVEEYNLSVTLTKSEDGGEYEVRATNEMGTSVTKSYVTVHSKSSTDEKTEEEVRKQSTTEITDELTEKITKEEDNNEEVKIKNKINKEKTEDKNEVSPKIEEPQTPIRTGPDVAPQILSSTLKDKDVYESLPNKFEIVASAEPRPEVKWLKDGEEISPSDTHTVLTKDGDTHRLEILATEQADAGVYTCKVTNRLGEVAESGTLNILPESLYRCPKVKVPIQDTRCPKHQSGSIAAVFTADPIPEFKWTREGKEVHAESNFTVKEEEYGLKECTVTLTIPRSEHRDTGLYTVTATNKYGTGESTGRYDVVFKPEITTFCDIMSPPQAQVVLSAHIHANPKPEISWIIEDEKIDIKADERLRSERDEEKEIYSLVINDTKRTDENMYTVVATNEFGESTKSARLRVQTDEPSFVKVLQDQTIKDYEYAEIKARAYGIPKPIITWWKDGEEVVPDDNISITVDYEGQTNSTLAFKHFREKNVGKYVAKAWNIAGEAKSNCRMKMFNILPSFSTTLSRSVELTEKEPLELRAKADGSPAPSIKWFKDGEPLEADDRVKIWSTPDGWQFLKIESTVPSDSGSYKIVATNQTGDCATTCGVGVNPEPMAPVFKKELSDAFAVEGGVLKLEAFIAGVPTPETKWLKDGIEIHPTPAINFVTAPNGEVGLEIEPAKMEDNGVYTLLVANRLGKIESTARGEVIYKEIKPKFNTHLLPLSLVEGFPARLEVQIEGHPEPEVIWFKDDMPLAIDGTRIKVVSSPDGTQALVIEDATPSDSGLYGVIAKNELGSSKTEAPLEILPRERGDVPEERPQFLHSMRDTTTDEGSSLSLVAPFIGNPIPEVLWHKDGQVIHPSERIRFYCDAHKVGLEIPKADLADAGVYSVFLKNCHGEATTAGKANVRKLYQAPTFIQRFTDLQQMPGYNAKFLARVTGIPTPDVAWYHDLRGIYDGGQGGKYRIKREGEVCCLYINNLDINDAGWYKCEATNKEGHADCDAALQVVDRIKRTPKIEPPSFLKRIGDCEIFRGMAAKFTACVTGYPEPYYEWYKSDERLFASDRIKMEREGTGILRLIINRVVPEHDLTTYKLRIYNDYGEATCEANLLLDSIEESRARKPVGDQYTDFTNYRNTGAPLPLADRPIISRMMDRRLTLSWRPSLPIGPRFPVTYHVEMAVQPDGDWFTARTGVRSCVCEISNLEPFRDYKFRVRVENKYGISDPSPFGMTHRGRLELPPPKLWDYLPPGIEFRPESSPYFPKDFDIERPPHDNYFQAPRFLRQEHETQYCVKGHNCNLFWFVYGYPKPKMTYFFNDEPIEMGGRYDCSYTRNGQATLFINRMLERDEGMYEAVATNEHGQARQRVRLRCAEYPVFIKRPEETYVMMRRSCRLEAKITGVPYPDIKWFKDWQPLAPSSRVRIQHIEPDTCVLVIADVILKDQGLYSISARNVAGSISTSVSLHVEESEGQFSFHSYSRFPHAKLKTRKATDLYDLGDELGRGTQGITYHAVERITGRNFAAKVMTGTKDYRFDMTEEFEVMNNLNHRNLIRLYEGYETTKTITIITELASGGELLDVLTRQTHVTEAEIAYYIRQILWGIEHMHHNSYAHLGLTPGDLLISHIGGDELKISDFGCSRKINYGKFHPLYYGMPEFVAPEVVRGDGVYFPADMWSIGVITHLFLTGVSLFRGRDDQETLLRIKNNQYQLSSSLSENARDFISKLLLIDTEARMDIKNALRHPWLNLADKPLSDPDHYEISTDCLRNYYNSYKDWYSNASCRTWYRRRKLETAFTHPSRMVYPPGHSYTPESTPPPQSKLPPHRTWEDQIPSREPIDVDIGMIKNESHYQYGPDTYLLQLRDVDFPVRLREYMKVAANRAPRLSQVFDHECHLDWRMPIIRERRRFTDVMDEEIDDERKARINRYGNFESLSTRRLRNEVGMRPDTRVEAEALMDAKREGQPPFFREKPQITPIFGNKVCDISYFVVGDPEPTIQWFKNDLVLTEGKRVKFLRDDEGRSVLRLNPALEYDVGTFKCVARNKCGQTVARMRLVAGGPPDAPDSPIAVETSDTEVLLRWKQPKEDGHAEVLCYRLQYKESHNPDWEDICSTINHEFWLVKNLKPNSNYLFRLAARNCHGWSKPGIPSEHITTEKEDTPKIVITVAMKHMQTMSESGRDIYEDEDELKLDYKVEREPIQWIDSLPTDNYRFLSEIFRGRFSVVVKGVRIEDERTVVAKLLEVNEKTEKQVMKEFENLRSLRHVRIAALLEAYKPSSHPGLVVFILEKLQGADILTALSSRHEYSEQVVMTVVSQLLDAVQYLHWRGLAHLDIQPDNVVMATTRSTQVKLVDFAATHYVSKLGTMVNPSNTCLDYDSPEVLCDEPAFPQSDIWSIGVLAYVLLSGKSPFRGENDQETRQNIIFVRYRFEHLYKELSQEATRFLMLIFKRSPCKRPTAEECQEHRWLSPTEFMIKKRERANFLGMRLKEYAEFYHNQRSAETLKSDLKSVLAVKATVSRSDSIQEELSSTYDDSHLCHPLII
ncbi:protein Obscurin isoform X3 [Bemisia tabaci]|uniref:protein Obscurin isoform X3 n=1 Tax=Bemisia tabaci TaxID=7038 RepID=UPI003B2822D4